MRLMLFKSIQYFFVFGMFFNFSQTVPEDHMVIERFSSWSLQPEPMDIEVYTDNVEPMDVESVNNSCCSFYGPHHQCGWPREQLFMEMPFNVWKKVLKFK